MARRGDGLYQRGDMWSGLAVELGPKYEAFRQWRRERQGDDPAPNDREATG